MLKRQHFTQYMYYSYILPYPVICFTQNVEHSMKIISEERIFGA